MKIINTPTVRQSADCKLSIIRFDEQFRLFQRAVRVKWNASFRSFRDGGPLEWEGYKDDVRKEAIRRLDSRHWKQALVGSGLILQRVVSAIEIKEPARDLVNNLVRWENRWGERGQSHRELVSAQKDTAKRQQFEQWFLDFFQSRIPNGEAFKQFCELAGSKYDLAAYLFFIKDDTKFMPIAPTTFDAAFERLGLVLRTSRNCSWENYSEFNLSIAEVQHALNVAMQTDNVRLLDAHSFIWMLMRLNVGKARSEILIPLPQAATSVHPVSSPAPSTTDDDEGRTMDGEDYDARNEARRLLGKIAEEIAFKSEQCRLRQGGRGDLADRIKDVSKCSALGYDILSFELNGEPRHIEVKAARQSKDKVSFFLSENERQKSRRLKNYFFYLVFGCRDRKPRVKFLTAGQLTPQALQPENYLANLSMD